MSRGASPRQPGIRGTVAFESKTLSSGSKCGTCGKQLSNPHGRRLHEALHVGKRPFSCPLCRRWFRLQWSRDLHQLRHGTPEGHVCTICGTMFGRCRSVKRHMLNIHGVRLDGSNPANQDLSRSLPGDTENHDMGNDANPSEADPTTTPTPLRLLSKLVEKVGGTTPLSRPTGHRSQSRV
jgi:hypothetical protein